MAYSRTKMGDELEKAATAWGKMIHEALEEKFGPNKAGYCIILTTAGKGGSMHMKTDLKQEGLGPMFKELGDNLTKLIIGRLH